jgi:Domain of unknown function (DUF4326)
VSEQRRVRSRCHDCGVNVTAIGHWYMVDDEVWAASGLGPEDGVLCLPCLERRLERNLVYEDFMPSDPENFSYWGDRRMVPRGWWDHLINWASTPLARAAPDPRRRHHGHCINLRGRKDRRVPEGAIYVGHAINRGGWRLSESKWANPFKIDRPGKRRDGSRDEVIDKYRAWLLQQPGLIAALPELEGLDLACWCHPERCHADVLLELASPHQPSPP